MPKRWRLVLRIQAFYYVMTGVWPLLSRRSFEAVTGRKRDWWLVQMVALLAISNGISLGAATMRENVSGEARMLSACTAFSFAVIDVVYVVRSEIRPVYLADAAVEGLILLVLGRSIRR